TPDSVFARVSPGVPFSITLNRGEGFVGRTTASSGTGVDLTGTIISADRPIGMTNGNKCTNVPSNRGFCDHIFEVAQPVQTWGKRVFVANLPNRNNGSFYRIVASKDNTTITQDDTLNLGILNAGEFIELQFVDGNRVFEGDSAIFVAQLMPSRTAPGSVSGDPGIANMAPSEQYMTSYTFSTVGGSQFATHFLSIIANDSAVGTMTLDGLVIPDSLFDSIGTTGYSAATMPLTEGTHATSSAPFTHGITVEGYNQDDSYLYPGGALFVPINPGIDSIAPICNLLSEDNCVASFQACDNADTAASGISSVFLAAGAVNLTLSIEPFIRGDSCVNYSVHLTDTTQIGSGTVVVRDLSGNTCSNDIDFTCPNQVTPIIICLGSTVNFDGCLDGGGKFPWCVDVPITGATSVDVSPSGPVWENNQLCGVVLQSGDFVYTLTATNQFGSTTCDVSVSFTLENPPVADFSYTPTSGQAPLTVNFTDQSSGTALSYHWDFGDGNSSSSQNPSNTYVVPGIYDVTLVVTNSCGSDTLGIGDAVEVFPAGDGPIPTPEWINVYCDQPMLNDVPLAPGDEIRAYDPDGVLCGLEVVRDDGSYGFMPIYRDDEFSPVDEGADPGDVISFTVNGEEVNTDPEIVWTANGDGFRLCLFSTEVCKTIHLYEGWNLISWNVNYAASMQDFVNILGKTGCVELIMSFDQGALTFDPALWHFSTLLDVDYSHGYWFKTYCDMSFEVCGQDIPDDGIVIYRGWNLVSYWPNEVLPIEVGFASVLDNLHVALGFDPNSGPLVYVSGDGDFNTLSELLPCNGYWIRSLDDDFLTYGPVPLARSHNNNENRSLAANVAPSRRWMSLYGSELTLDGRPLADNSSIEVLSESGILVGEGVYANQVLKFTPVYGSDPSEEATADYPSDGDRLVIRVNGQTTNTEVTWQGHGSRIELNNLSTGSGNGTLPVEFGLSQNYPNPFNPSTEISFSLKQASEVTLDIYNIAGQKVTTLVNGQFEAGEHTVQWDARDLNGQPVATGMYLYRLQAGDFVQTRKMMLLK
ncbi:MAG: PKD domain-containing protein, partial [Candidatus Zixiibacteriota bacterium]